MVERSMWTEEEPLAGTLAIQARDDAEDWDDEGTDEDEDEDEDWDDEDDDWDDDDEDEEDEGWEDWDDDDDDMSGKRRAPRPWN